MIQLLHYDFAEIWGLAFAVGFSVELMAALITFVFHGLLNLMRS